jgi:glutathione S-transferase
MSLTLFDLCDANGQPMSPYCWRIRESLTLLSVSFDVQLLGLIEIRQLFSDTHKTVPVLSDGGNEIGGSWTIAEYLNQNYDAEKRLFAGLGGYSMAAFVTRWVDASILGPVNRMMVKDIHDNLRSEDQDYYRSSQEALLGDSLEHIQSTRESALPPFQKSLHPARSAIKQQPFIDGDMPTYADFALHSTFQWTRTVTDFEILRADDRLNKWINRMDEWLASVN